jgi:2-dehydropantoate 2-reductase
MATEAPLKHVVVIGPGAIGLCLAVRLARQGRRVTLIDHRPDRAARLSARPIRLRGPAGDDVEAAIPVRLVPDVPPNLVILATKAHAARAAAGAAATWIGAAPVLLVQNGLGVAAEVAQALPQATVITAVLYQGANLTGEGEVHHVANFLVHVGYEGRPPDEAAEAVAATLAAAGLPARVAQDMTPVVWGKLLVNAAINPVAALAGVTNGAVADRPSLRAMAQAIAEEGEAAARAAGVALPYASAAEAAWDTARRTADNRCSMLQDLEAGKPTEIEYLNGAIVRVAEAHAVAVPANRAVASLVRQVSARPPTAAQT